MRYAYILMLLLIGYSCKNGSTGQKETARALNELTAMDGYPEGFVGCGCAFSVNKHAFENKQFIYLKKYGMPDEAKNFEIISVNGKEIKWFFGEDPADFSIQKEYTTATNIDQEQEEKEGKLILTFKDGTVLETAFYGSCGC